MKRIQLSDHFTYGKLIRFTLPTIATMIFSSIYGIVDGFFVSNFAGKTPFASLNLIFPYLMILGTIGFMFGTGGSALVSKTLGEGKQERAQRLFSLLIYFPAAVSVLLTVIGFFTMPGVARLLGADAQMLPYCVTYGRIVISTLPFFTMQMEFQEFFVTAEKPHLGFWVTLAAGCTNMALDALFVAGFSWGLSGAAWATAISQTVGGVIPIFYFARKNASLLRLRRTSFEGKVIAKASSNGFSEFLSSISMSLVGMLFNFQLMKYAGENGIAAYGTIMYIDMIFFSAFIGYASGTMPVIGFHYGAGNHEELHSLLKKGLILMIGAGCGMMLLAEVLSRPLALIFTSYDAELLAMTVRAFRIYATSFVVCGVAIFGSSFFTGLNNGLISALISFLRTIVFETTAVLLLPLLFGLDGIWYSIVLSRVLAMSVTILLLVKFRKRYHY